MRVILFLHRVGPYHDARFQEASKSIDLIVVETRPGSEEYEWKFNPTGKYIIEKFRIGTNPEIGIRGNQLKKSIYSLFEKYHPHVIVTTGWADPEYHSVVLEANKRNIPKVIISDSRQEDEPRKFYKEWIKRILLRSYEAALVAGTESQNYLLQLGYEEENIFHPWDVIDNKYFDGWDRPSLDFFQRDFICVSRFIPKKNLEGLISTFNEYKKKGGKRNLILLGTGELETKLREMVSKYNLEKFIFFKGFAQYEALPDYLYRSFFLILPSWSDQWGLVVNEAMAAGLPVIVSNRCGCTVDLVKNDINGYIFDPYNQHQLVEKMMSADLLDEVQWMEMCNKSKQEIERWTVKDFAYALLCACNRAVMHSRKGTFTLLHRLLSR